MVRDGGRDTPFILVSGAIGEEVAVQAMKAGANDYLLKGNLTRLIPTVRRELREAEERQAARRMKMQLELSEIRYRRLFETAHDGTLLIDAKTGEILDVNRVMVDLLHYPPEHFLRKQLWEIEAFREITWSKTGTDTLSEQGTLRYKEATLNDSGGRSIPVDFYSSVYSEGAHIVIQCNVRDISTRKRIDHELS